MGEGAIASALGLFTSPTVNDADLDYSPVQLSATRIALQTENETCPQCRHSPNIFATHIAVPLSRRTGEGEQAGALGLFTSLTVNDADCPSDGKRNVSAVQTFSEHFCNAHCCPPLPSDGRGVRGEGQQPPFCPAHGDKAAARRCRDAAHVPATAATDSKSNFPGQPTWLVDDSKSVSPEPPARQSKRRGPRRIVVVPEIHDPNRPTQQRVWLRDNTGRDSRDGRNVGGGTCSPPAAANGAKSTSAFLPRWISRARRGRGRWTCDWRTQKRKYWQESFLRHSLTPTLSRPTGEGAIADALGLFTSQTVNDACCLSVGKQNASAVGTAFEYPAPPIAVPLSRRTGEGLGVRASWPTAAAKAAGATSQRRRRWD